MRDTAPNENDEQSGERRPRLVALRDAALAAAFADRLDALTTDDPTAQAYIIPGRVEICHMDQWLIAEAVYEDDAWQLDFSRYGDDLPPLSASGGDDRAAT